MNGRKMAPPLGTTLGQSLSRLREAGTGCDVEFLVGPEGTSVKAHKLILTARSPDVFETMFNERWNSEQDKDSPILKIPLPSHSVDAFTLLIEFMYCDSEQTAWSKILEKKTRPMSREATEEMIIDILQLGHLYELPDVIAKSAKYLQTGVGVDWTNCVVIYLATRIIEECKEANEKAFRTLRASLPILFQHPSTFNVEMLDRAAWAEILAADDLFVEEEKLFVAAILNAVHTDLIHLIRFPLMKAEKFTEIVEPSGLLSEDDISELKGFFENGIFLQHPTKFNSTPRHKNIAWDSEKLEYLLRFMGDEEAIHLLPGAKYRGPFKMYQNRTKIIGYSDGNDPSEIFVDGRRKGPTCVCIYGDGCEISDVKLSAKTVSGTGIVIEGCKNVVKNCTITGHVRISNRKSMGPADNKQIAGMGIVIQGNENTIRDVKIKYFYNNGICINGGNRNKVVDVECENVKIGAALQNASSNEVENLSCSVYGSKNHKLGGRKSVLIKGGTENKVKSVKCVSYSGKDVIGIETDSDTSNCTLNDIKAGGRVWICGTGHTLDNLTNMLRFCSSVPVAMSIMLEGSGHTLTNCTADEIDQSECTGDISVDDSCVFKIVKKAATAVKTQTDMDSDSSSPYGSEDGYMS